MGVSAAMTMQTATSTPAFRHIDTNGVRLRVVVDGQGPLLILLHGFPQCWYLWRHQIAPLVAAGYQVAVPDQRGYGGSDCPEPVDAYNIVDLCKDVVGIADALGHDQFTLIVHDWGAVVGWHTALLHPERVRAIAALSVPYARLRAGVLTRQERFGDRFFYIVYFQVPGIAEAELEADIRRSLRIAYYTFSGDAPEGVLRRPKPAGSRLLDGMIDPQVLPSWLSELDLDYYEAQFRKSGFRGAINWYRNIDRNVGLTAQLETAKVHQPCFFISGSKDPVRLFLNVDGLKDWVTDLRGNILLAGAGHWLPLERTAEVNAALLGFLREVT